MAASKIRNTQVARYWAVFVGVQKGKKRGSRGLVERWNITVWCGMIAARCNLAPRYITPVRSLNDELDHNVLTDPLV